MSVVVSGMPSPSWSSPKIILAMTSRRSSRLSVKSCFTRTAPPSKLITASRSGVCICSLMNFNAAEYARDKSAGGIALMSK